MGCMPYKRLTTVILILGAVASTNTFFLVHAAQIAPNPNPEGSTIDIINDPFAFNNADPYTNFGAINIEAGSTLTNNTGATLANGVLPAHSVGTINISAGGTLLNNGTLNNYSVASGGGLINSGILANTGSMTSFGGPTLGAPETLINASGGLLTNSGTYLGWGAMHNYGTLINTGTWHNVEDSVTNSGTWINTSYTIFDAGSGLRNSTGATLINAGTWEFPTQGITNTGTVTNTGTGVLSLGYLRNLAGGTAFNAGTLNTKSGITNEAGATLINTNTVALVPSVFGPGTITNSGTVINLGSIVGAGTYTQTAGQTINNGSLNVTSVVINGGALSGTGTINANVTVGSGAIVSPGNSPGTMTINGNLASSGNYLFQIGGLQAGQFDVLKVNGNATFSGGNIIFDFTNGFKAAVGNAWNFLYASAITGWNTLTVSVTGLSSDQTYALSYVNGAERLTVYNVPEPSSLLLLAAGLAGMAGLRRMMSQKPNKD